jgi:hypothetical protein
MTIKQQGGVFGRNPTFNDLTVEGTLVVNGEPISDFGTMAQQDANAVNIDGGNIDGTAIGISSPSSISGTTGTFSGNLAVDTDTLFVDAANSRVGVGASSPDQKLEVRTTGSSPLIRVTTNADGAGDPQGGLEWYEVNSAQVTASITGARGGGAFNQTSLVFNTADGGANTERLRILPSGGITFNGDTAAANALDDYEEGTWTPTDNSGAGLSLTASGFYTKIGRQVTLTFTITYPANLDASAAVIGNLPFAAGDGNLQSGGYTTFKTYASDIRLFSAGANLEIYDGSASQVVNSALAAHNLRGVVTYFV